MLALCRHQRRCLLSLPPTGLDSLLFHAAQRKNVSSTKSFGSLHWHEKTTICIAKYFPELEAHKDYCRPFSTQKYSTNMTLSAFCNMVPRRGKILSSSPMAFSVVSSALGLPGSSLPWYLITHGLSSHHWD